MGRIRRKLSTGQVAEWAGISRSTLWQIEKGLPNVSMRYYAQTNDKATAIIQNTVSVVSKWKQLAAKYKLSRDEQDGMAPVFKTYPAFISKLVL